MIAPIHGVKRKPRKTRGQVYADNAKLAEYARGLEKMLGDCHQVTSDAIEAMGPLIVPAMSRQMAALQFVSERTRPFKGIT